MKNRSLVPRIAEHGTFKLIGLGGVGGVVARYGALFLASFDVPLRLVLIDGDHFEPGNTARMVFTRHGNKAAVVRDDLLAYVGDSRLSVLAIEQHVTAGNVERLIHEGDTVLLAVDNHATRKLVSDHCAGLSEVCLVSGGNDGVEDGLRGTYGNCQIYVRQSGEELTPSLTHLHPEIQKPADRLPTDPNCTDLAASVPQILFANLAAASSMLNALWLHLCGELHYGELCFDIAEGLMRPVQGRFPNRGSGDTFEGASRPQNPG